MIRLTSQHPAAHNPPCQRCRGEGMVTVSVVKTTDSVDPASAESKIVRQARTVQGVDACPVCAAEAEAAYRLREGIDLMSGVLCIYHGNCADGFGAAWAVRKAFDERRIEFHAGVYQRPPPDVTDRHVVMVDFSYKRPVIDEMAKAARSILILDHHKSARDDLSGYAPPPDTWDDWMEAHDLHEVTALFDMNRSGAGITWDFFHDTTRPPLIDYLEDRDLWRFALDGTRQIQASVFSYPYDFKVWDWLMSAEINGLRAEGVAIERKHFKDIDELIGVVKRRMTIGGHDVPVASLPYTLTSDAGHKMAQGEPFAACYWDTAAGRVFSLRSSEQGLDVSEIAKAYGGGGHRNAAGFEVPRDHELARA